MNDFASYDALVTSLEKAGLLAPGASFEECEEVLAGLEAGKFDAQEPS